MNRTSDPRNDRRGSTLVLVTFFTMGLSVLGLSLLMTVRGSQQEELSSVEDLSALYVCDAAMSAAIMDLNLGGDGTLGSRDLPDTFGSGSYWVETADLGSGIVSLRATGGDQHARVRTELIVRKRSSGVFQWAAFSDEGLHMDSNAMTDSYDSSQGTYESQEVNGSGSDTYADSDGDVGSNTNITMDQNTIVYGDGTPGPSGTVTLSGSAVITGSTLPSTDTTSLSEITVPSIPSSGDLVVTSDQTLASGDHAYATFHIDNNTQLVVTGPARVVVNDFILDSNSELMVDATNGPVEFWVHDDFILNSNSLVASTDYLPSNVAFNLLSDNVIDPDIDVDVDVVDFDSNTHFFGTIYAPNAYIQINSNFELFGSLVARRIDLDSFSKIHHDEALRTSSSSSSSQWETLCWRILSEDE